MVLKKIEGIVEMSWTPSKGKAKIEPSTAGRQVRFDFTWTPLV